MAFVVSFGLYFLGVVVGGFFLSEDKDLRPDVKILLALFWPIFALVVVFLVALGGLCVVGSRFEHSRPKYRVVADTQGRAIVQTAFLFWYVEYRKCASPQKAVDEMERLNAS